MSGSCPGACFADFGHHVTCIDKDAGKIAALEPGEIPIYEPGSRVASANMREGRLRLRPTPRRRCATAEAVFIAVGTPSRRGDGHADLSYVYAAVREIAPLLSGFAVVITKSTVPIGTGDEVERILRETAPDDDIPVVSNPEFLREGRGHSGFQASGPHRRRHRRSARARRDGGNLSAALSQRGADPLHRTAHRRTDQIRRQRFLATKITFINEIADLCEKVGRGRPGGRARHRARQPHRLEIPARGAGLWRIVLSEGYARALIKTAQDHGVPLRIVETVVAVNDQRKRAMARKVSERTGGSIRGKTIAVLGLTFKPNTDDMREAPSIALITALQDLGAAIRAYDPAGMEQAEAVPARRDLSATIPTRLRARRRRAGASSPNGSNSARSTSPTESGHGEPSSSRTSTSRKT